MSVDNRPGPAGPAKGMGQRPNAQGLDLNRDHVKLESPEARAQAAFLSEWDPHVVIDTHTTNGSRHRYTVTYAAPLHPSVHAESAAFVRDELLPEVSARLEERTGYGSFFYGNFDREKTMWQTYAPMPRYGGNYRGLRGHMAILSEAYSYAPYRDRVLVTLEFVREILGYVAGQAERVVELHEDARQQTTDRGRNPQPDDLVGLRHRPALLTEPALIRTYLGDTDEPVDVSVVHLGRFEPTRSVRRPHAYVLGPGTPDTVLDNLRRHGIAVEPFEGAARVEIYTITAIDRPRRPFQGHHMVEAEAVARVELVEVPAGAQLVTTAQPLGTLVVHLLEPECEDGLVAWNFFDDVLEVGADFPVMRVAAPSDLP
jgi:hypothetical protein